MFKQILFSINQKALPRPTLNPSIEIFPLYAQINYVIYDLLDE